jgi:hypothetical protein
MQEPNLSGKTVLIIGGEFAGEEGVCLGPASDAKDLWAVSPHSSNRVINLKFSEEFGVLINPGQSSGRN